MALVTIRRSPSVQAPMKTDGEDKPGENDEDDPSSRISKSLNECYFANKGAALVLGEPCGGRPRSPARAPPPDIQSHLQDMFGLLRPEETLKMAVKLESAHVGRTRYLVVVCRGEEAALLGIDCNERTTVGLVLRVLADTSIKLDGDGGFSVCVCSQQHIFKPVSVQAMWSALQTLHRSSGRARACNHFAGGPSHAWVAYYEERVGSDRSCLNEWHAMDCIESRRPPSPDSLRHKPREREETERVIRCTLKEIMMSVDLDEVTSKVIRGRLEEDLDMDLAEYKSFIDQEMLTILGQMDAPTEIFDHVYLGSEWNASNLEELQRNGIRHILNVTREIDNFFPGMFDYLNIRVYDDDKTDLLKHWDNTFKYINKAKTEGSKVLVHCKMGISRSASVVIAYAMKAYNWNFDKALKHVKTKRTCIKPNTNFLSQLETYQGILDAMKNKEKLQRSKSETNLKCQKSASKSDSKSWSCGAWAAAWAGGVGGGGSRAGGRSRGGRPRSWSPDAPLAGALLPPTSVSLEHLAPETRHKLMPCANGTYSVSPNQIIRLKEDGAPSVRHIVHEIETRKLHRPLFSEAPCETTKNLPSRQHRLSQSADAEKIHTWDPGEPNEDLPNAIEIDDIVKCDSGIVDVKGSAEAMVCGDIEEPCGPSRQSSWSSSDSGAGRGGSGGGTARTAADLAIINEGREARAKRKDISDNERKFNETCAILKELASTRGRGVGAGGAATWGGRLSASAPADSWLRAGPRRRRLAAASHGDLRSAAAPAAAGLVSNLKKEFEARSAGEGGRVRLGADEVSVRVLVGRYDRAADAPPQRPAWEPRAPPFLRNSFCGAVRGGADRPPLAPNVVSLAPINYPSVLMSTVMSKAQNKKQLQHGKTHPLTRLNMNRSNNRCSNPVYNTM